MHAAVQCLDIVFSHLPLSGGFPSRLLLAQVGICGEHGGEPASVAFFHNNDFDYVSCSPFRVPIARIAAGQAAAMAAQKAENQKEKNKKDKLYRESITNVKLNPKYSS